MTGGTSFHDIILLNIGAELRERLRGSPCRARGSKLCDYDATESIKTYALIDQSEPRLLVYRRDASGHLLSSESSSS